MPHQIASDRGKLRPHTASFYPTLLAAGSVSLAGSTLPAQPRNVDTPKSPSSLLPLYPRGELIQAQGFVTSTCNMPQLSLSAPPISLLSEAHLASSCLLNIATQGLRRPSDSTCSRQTHILPAPHLGPLQRAGPSTIQLSKPRGVAPPGSHPAFSLTLTPDVTYFTSSICRICPFLSISHHPATCLTQTVARVSILVSHTYLSHCPIHSPLFKTQI